MPADSSAVDGTCEPSDPLTNARHERFAQHLAVGKSATEAYALAGYRPNDGNAARLKGNDRIAARLAFLQRQAADLAVIDRQWVLDRLRDNALDAMAGKQHSAANRALELLGREVAGMFLPPSEGDRMRAAAEQLLDALMPHCDATTYKAFLRALWAAMGHDDGALASA